VIGRWHDTLLVSVLYQTSCFISPKYLSVSDVYCIRLLRGRPSCIIPTYILLRWNYFRRRLALGVSLSRCVCVRRISLDGEVMHCIQCSLVFQIVSLNSEHVTASRWSSWTHAPKRVNAFGFFWTVWKTSSLYLHLVSLSLCLFVDVLSLLAVLDINVKSSD